MVLDANVTARCLSLFVTLATLQRTRASFSGSAQLDDFIHLLLSQLIGRALRSYRLAAMSPAVSPLCIMHGPILVLTDRHQREGPFAYPSRPLARVELPGIKGRGLCQACGCKEWRQRKASSLRCASVASFMCRRKLPPYEGRSAGDCFHREFSCMGK